MPVHVPKTTTAASSVQAPRAASTSASVGLDRPLNSDRGLKMTHTDNSITLSGVAKGPYAVNPFDRDSVTATDYERTQEVGANVSFQFDRDRMPNFDTSKGYTEKNRWYAAHVADVPCRKGQTAEQVLLALAEKVNENKAYRAVVTTGDNGSATLTVQRK